MSDAPSAKNSSADVPAADATPAGQRKPKSSRVGRIVIGILLLVLAVEAAAHLRMTWAKSKLTAELAKAEAEEYEPTRESMKKLLGGREPDLSKHIQVGVGEELYDGYYFNGLLKRRVLCVHYGIQGETDADDSHREMMEVLTVIPEVV
ncbi:MAG: hypothetical protein AB7U20_20330, partial [Planctomycetaceae bacterium]